MGAGAQSKEGNVTSGFQRMRDAFLPKKDDPLALRLAMALTQGGFVAVIVLIVVLAIRA